MQLDKDDIAIIEALRKDGRASFRDIARVTSISTPTVSSRLSRMIKGGIIRGFIPIFGSVDMGTAAVVTMEVPVARVDKVSKKLAAMDRVSSVLITAGRDNLIIRVNLDSPSDLPGFLQEIEHSGRVADSRIITRIVKEGQPAPKLDRVPLKLSCDYCNGDITSQRPYTYVAGPIHYYFCCRTCRKSFLEKYGAKIEKLELDEKVDGRSGQPPSTSLSNA